MAEIIEGVQSASDGDFARDLWAGKSPDGNFGLSRPLFS
jgi:hypothetical protein